VHILSNRFPSELMMRAERESMRRYYHRLHQVVREKPIILIPVFLGHLLLSGMAAGAAFLCALLALAFGRDGVYFAEWLFTTVFFLLVITVWLHFAWLSLSSVRANVVISGDQRRVSGVLQALLSVIFGFSVLFYYLQLFSGNSAFEGMHPIHLRDYDFEDLPTLVERLLILPPWETVVDCFYFSVVTITTLGFGDIRPVSPVAKLITSAEVVAGFILIVLALGSVLGKPSEASAA
jgi:hypothetical protein